jgi:hypothetical protein
MIDIINEALAIVSDIDFLREEDQDVIDSSQAE